MKKANLKNLFICTLLVSSTNVFSIDFNQPLPGELDLKDSPYENDQGSNDSEEDKNSIPDIFGSTPQQYTDEELKNAVMNSQDKEWLKTATDEDSILRDPSPNSYVEYKTEDLLIDVYQKADTQIGFTYIYDTYDYSDSTGTFESIFQNDNSEADSIQAGYLTFNYRNYFQRNIVSTFFQGNLGLSFNSGKGKFGGGTISRTTFNLWLFPIDLNLGAKLNLGKKISITAQGGPVIAPIWQNRDDREQGDDDKDIRQVGYGYNASASIDFSIYNIFPNFGMDLKKFSDISEMSISLMAKTMDISGFKREDFSVSGVSFGIGFNFEYL
ncbi:hypothetical protein ACRXCV_02505 [Halobacteriovorax sp. GFR7]|uniref:hypothetical protein n=1 Tax=unclassified Halobacteriovorax TaxID=2639665 RepID=UPI003D971994